MPASPDKASIAMALAKAVQTPNLEANGVLLPSLVDSDTQGAFVDLVRAIDAAYPDGEIDIRAYPAARAYANAASGLADFSFPVMRLSAEVEATLPYRFTTESVGRVCFVLYSHKRKPLRPADLLQAAQRGQPYAVQAPLIDWGFPTQQFLNFESAFKMIDMGRIDGFLWAQEEADLVLRQLGLTSIHRAHFADYDDVFIVPRNPRGDFVNQVLTRVIRKMRADGSLAAIYAKVHRPYQDWQL